MSSAAQKRCRTAVRRTVLTCMFIEIKNSHNDVRIYNCPMLTRTYSRCIAGQRRQNAVRADILTPKPRPTSLTNCPSRVGSCLGPPPPSQPPNKGRQGRAVGEVGGVGKREGWRRRVAWVCWRDERCR